MSQSRKHSMFEIAVGTTTGFLGSLIITYLCALAGWPPAVQALVTTGLCTVWSIGRGYYLRRLFNRMSHRL